MNGQYERRCFTTLDKSLLLIACVIARFTDLTMFLANNIIISTSYVIKTTEIFNTTRLTQIDRVNSSTHALVERRLVANPEVYLMREIARVQ